jgi:hypothetical protein
MAGGDNPRLCRNGGITGRMIRIRDRVPFIGAVPGPFSDLALAPSPIAPFQ